MNLLGRDFESGQMARDMNLFVDDDGKAYHIYASEDNSTLHISELTDDYTACSGNYARFFVGRFMEAPAMFKKDGKYYLIMSGCTGWAPNPGRSAVASSIWGRGKNWRTRLWELIRKPLSTLRALMCCLFPASPDSSSTWETADTEERHRRPLYLVAYPFRRRTAGYRVAGRMGN